MTEQEFREVKDFWKLTYAEKGIEQAMDCIKYIFENNIKRTHPLFDALLVSIYTLYCRPFTKNALVGSLDSEFIPKDYKAFHGQLIKFRHELFAHSDTQSNRTAQHGPLLQVGCAFKPMEPPDMFTTSLQLQEQHLQIMLRYFLIIHQIIHAKMILKWNAFVFGSHRPAQDGDYILNIYDNARPVWITRDEAIKLCPSDAELINAVAPPIEN